MINLNQKMLLSLMALSMIGLTNEEASGQKKTKNQTYL